MKKIAKFEKISLEQFIKDTDKFSTDNAFLEETYLKIDLPKRATAGSAGHDFKTPFRVSLKPGESIKIPTGIRCNMADEFVLSIYPRSSMGFKYNMTLLNTVGIIDSDYYYADNEGHIIIAIKNNGDRDLNLEAGDRFAQGLFTEYGICVDDEATASRHGGFGSTN